MRGFGQLRQAPARQLGRVGHAADREPAVTVGDDCRLVAPAGELLRRERRALRGGEALGPVLEPVLVDEVDVDRVLSAIRLDKVGLLAHIGRLDTN